MDTPTFLAHLQDHGTPLTLPRGGTLRWDDADLHRAAHTRDPEGYALAGVAAGARDWQRARVLLQILAASQAGLDEPARAVQARVARVLTLGLPPAHVITVLLALRRLRANHKHTTRTALRFVLEHPDADALIAARRPALLDCFEHALGKAAARGCARRIDAGDTGSEYLRRRLLRFLTAPAAAPARVRALYSAPRPEPRGEPRALPQRAPLPVDAAAAAFPRFDGTVVVVLDAPAPQAAALARVLAQVCARLEVIETGPVPPGAAGPAAGVRDAVAAGPDLVAVVSGGDGGALFGDALFGGLARAAVPVVLCHAPPAGGDPASAPPRRGFRQPDDLAGLLPWMLGHCTAGAPWVRAALHARLDDLDRRAGGLTARRAA